MYPFFILDLPRDASDEDVDRRYHELLRKYPPDRAPEEFREIRRAFEALRDRRARLRVRLFHFDETGRRLLEAHPPWSERERRRLSVAELADLLRRTAAEGGE
jgi:DnaJ-class molecular chaperone